MLNDEETIEIIAAQALNLYRASLTAGNSQYSQQLYQEVRNPLTGDLVVDVKDYQRPARQRLGYLQVVMAESNSYIVRLLNGRHVKWQNPTLVKVLQRPFDMTSEPPL